MVGAAMNVLVTGSSGLVGTAIVQALRARGDAVRTLVRRAPRNANEARWDPSEHSIDAHALDGIDAVVHLAGEGVAERRWTEEHKRAVLESRRDGTRTLCGAIAQAETKPRVLVSASAVGYYGDTGKARITEDSPAGSGFLVEVCQLWEGATKVAKDAGVRVVNGRVGVVFAKEGGAFPKMALPFKMGVGGRIGDGTQGFSWVALEDVVGGILFAIDHDSIVGPMNLVSPNPVSNAELTKALGRAFRRPALLPVPGFALRLAAGREMADEMLLGGCYAFPERLLGAGYRFRYERIEDVLAVLARA